MVIYKCSKSFDSFNFILKCLDSDFDDVIDDTPPPKENKTHRKPKESGSKTTVRNSKHSRIRQIVDSSDDEDESSEQPPPSPQKPLQVNEKENKTPPKMNGQKKAKRTVTRTYLDDDGYMG